MNAATLINQTSGDVEFFTPPEIIEAARRTMTAIDLDPASCVAANRIVAAADFFTKEQDGLSFRWHGNVWMNHPFHKGEEVCDPETCKRKTCRERGHHCAQRIPGNAEWINKLVSEYAAGYVTQACCITFASTSEAWFQPLLKYPQCFLSPRTNYIKPDGTVFKGITKGSVVTYLGPRVREFADAFRSFGVVKCEIVRSVIDKATEPKGER